MRERKDIEDEFQKNAETYYGYKEQIKMAQIQLEALLDMRDFLYDLTK